MSEPFNPGVNAAIIPLASRPPLTGSTINVTGWGANSQLNTAKLPLFLQQATNLVLLSQVECFDRWGSYDTITERMICAFSSSQSTCNGDSGGPAVQNGVLVGVVSWGSSWCLHPTHPNVYANVSNLREWILSVSFNSTNNNNNNNGSNGIGGGIMIQMMFLIIFCTIFDYSIFI